MNDTNDVASKLVDRLIEGEGPRKSGASYVSFYFDGESDGAAEFVRNVNRCIAKGYTVFHSQYTGQDVLDLVIAAKRKLSPKEVRDIARAIGGDEDPGE